jgi:biopolymer transport protein ExbD
MGFKMQHAPRKKPKIEIVPLIDIMFFLFAVVLMISLSMTRNLGLTVPVPGASTAQPNKDDKDNVTLTVTEKGEILMGREKTSVAQLEFKLQSIKNANKEAKVTINGEATADWKHIVQVFDVAKKIGLKNVTVSTAKK